MTTTNLLEAILGLALIVYICTRQLTWTPVNVASMWRMPVILAIIGVVTVVQSGQGSRLTGTDIALMLIEAAAAILTGAAMGFIAVFRPITERGLARVAAMRRQPEVAPTRESRTGWLGIVLWVVLVGVRVGLGFWGHSMGSAIAESSGIILLTVALNRAVRTLVFGFRLDRHLARTAG